MAGIPVDFITTVVMTTISGIIQRFSMRTVERLRHIGILLPVPIVAAVIATVLLVAISAVSSWCHHAAWSRGV